MCESKPNIDNKKIEELVSVALNARNSAYAPYSNYRVGAALLTVDNQVYSGTNIENASYPAGICAERSALIKAISDGNMEFSAIVITGAPAELKEAKQFAYPCGVCRQFMAEFFDKNTKVIVAKSKIEYCIYNFEEIMPFSFGKTNLEN